MVKPGAYQGVCECGKQHGPKPIQWTGAIQQVQEAGLTYGMGISTDSPLYKKIAKESKASILRAIRRANETIQARREAAQPDLFDVGKVILGLTKCETSVTLKQEETTNG